MNFSYGQFHFNLITDEIIQSQFLEATIRGGFGYVFRNTVCINRDAECSNCDFRFTCTYQYVFETIPPADSKIMRKYNKIPHPFTIRLISADKKNISFELKLFGDSIKFFPYFIHSFINLGRKGLGKNRDSFILDRVLDITTGKELFADGTLSANSPASQKFDLTSSESQGNINGVKIHLMTPLSIREDGNLMREMNPEKFIITLLRRITNLSYFHADTKLDIDFRKYKELAQQFIITDDNTYLAERKRYSTRQKQNINMIGMLGDFTIEGNITPVYNFLRLGKIIHVGRGTSFGQGYYEMKVAGAD
jgi:hypothetical protein